MSEKITVRELVIVEGRYDKTALSQILDAHIITTGGFEIFHAAEKRELLRRLGEQYGVIVLTDSDGGGRQIRAYLSGILPKEKIKHLYTPCIEGKEKRKKMRSRAGLLGVEGMSVEILRGLFAPFAADADRTRRGREVTKTDLYEWGLLGGEGSAARRAEICRRLGLPEMSSNALLAAMNLLGDYESARAVLTEVESSSAVSEADEKRKSAATGTEPTAKK